jgi:hypothetical protein
MEQTETKVVYLPVPRNVEYVKVVSPERGVVLNRLPVTPEMRDEDDRMIDVLHAMGFLQRDDCVVLDYRESSGETWIVVAEGSGPELILRPTS